MNNQHDFPVGTGMSGMIGNTQIAEITDMMPEGAVMVARHEGYLGTADGLVIKYFQHVIVEWRPPMEQFTKFDDVAYQINMIGIVAP